MRAKFIYLTFIYFYQSIYLSILIIIYLSAIYNNNFQIMSEVQTKIKTMIQNGQDPKEYLLEVCRPTCIAKQERLQRCENKLKAMTHADP